MKDRLPVRLHPEALVAYENPAEELAKVARDRHAGLVVMGLHGSPVLGPRMGLGDLIAYCASLPHWVLLFPSKRVEASNTVMDGSGRGHWHRAVAMAPAVGDDTADRVLALPGDPFTYLSSTEPGRYVRFRGPPQVVDVRQPVLSVLAP